MHTLWIKDFDNFLFQIFFFFKIFFLQDFLFPKYIAPYASGDNQFRRDPNFQIFLLGGTGDRPRKFGSGVEIQKSFSRPSSGALGTIHAKDGVCAMISLDFIIRRPFGVVLIF